MSADIRATDIVSIGTRARFIVTQVIGNEVLLARRTERRVITRSVDLTDVTLVEKGARDRDFVSTRHMGTTD